MFKPLQTASKFSVYARDARPVPNNADTDAASLPRSNCTQTVVESSSVPAGTWIPFVFPETTLAPNANLFRLMHLTPLRLQVSLRPSGQGWIPVALRGSHLVIVPGEKTGSSSCGVFSHLPRDEALFPDHTLQLPKSDRILVRRFDLACRGRVARQFGTAAL